jgi:hypothetical protein
MGSASTCSMLGAEKGINPPKRANQVGYTGPSIINRYAQSVQPLIFQPRVAALCVKWLEKLFDPSSQRGYPLVIAGFC